MFQEDLAKLTADHLRLHINGYLDYIDARFPDNSVKLVPPKAIEVASAVGGLMQDFDKILPLYGVDIWGKTFALTVDNLFTWEYAGQVAGLVSASSQSTADKLIKRHAAAAELFVKQHYYLHETANDYFRVMSFVAAGIEFSGAEYVGEAGGREVWLGGFSLDCIWTTSESENSQHV